MNILPDRFHSLNVRSKIIVIDFGRVIISRLTELVFATAAVDVIVEMLVYDLPNDLFGVPKMNSCI